MQDGTLVRDNEAAHRFEIQCDGKTAFAVYRREGNALVFTHTEVPAVLEGHGIGTRLVGAALHSARQRGLRVIPACPFVGAYMHRHPETHDLIARG